MKPKFGFYEKICKTLICLACSSIVWNCNTTLATIYRPVETLSNEPTQNYDGLVYKAIILEFSNSSEIKSISISSDDEDEDIQPTITENDSENAMVIQNSFLAQSAREMTETALFQSGRFEVIPVFRYESIKQKYLEENPEQYLEAHNKAISDLGIQFIIYGDLSDFEIKTQTSYWKVPFWAILLVASFFIKDRDTREFVWYALIRAATIVPLDHALWDAGVGQEDIDLDVRIAMDLRMIDARSGMVVFSDTKTVLRKEKASNLELVVWKSDKKITIKKSNAGKQIRFASFALVEDLSQFIANYQMAR